MADPKRNKKGLKICCAVTAILLAVIFAVLLILFFTIFKLKDPVITAKPTALNLNFSFIDLPTSVKIGFLITVKNLNYGSFTFENTTSYVDFHGTIVAEAPIEARYVPPLGEINITTSGDLMVKKMISSPAFFGDFQAGSLNLTSSASLPGRVRFLKIFKFSATAISTCDIIVFIKSKDVVTKCVSKIKL